MHKYIKNALSNLHAGDRDPTAEQIAAIADGYTGRSNIAIINAAYRKYTSSALWPVNNRFNLAERAINRARKYSYGETGLEYCLNIEAIMSEIVNGEYN